MAHEKVNLSLKGWSCRDSDRVEVENKIQNLFSDLMAARNCLLEPMLQDPVYSCSNFRYCQSF